MLINKMVFNPKRYSSGELKLVKSELNKYIKDGKVEILYENDLSFFELLIILKYYKKQNTKIDLILSYLPYQRMEHSGRDELDTMHFVANIINDLKLESVVVCEPHCEIDCIDNSTSFSYLKKLKDIVIKEIGFDEETDNVVFTDNGGFKRYSKLFNGSIYFNKQRDLVSGLITKQEIVGKIKPDKKVLIVDDIISTGDTIVNIVEYLKMQNVKQIYILCGHIENNKHNQRLQNYDIVKMMYSTNSLKKKEDKKIKLFNIREIIYE